MSDQDTRYEAVRSRDARFDGEFFFAVETTGIYCRPSCPAVTPKRQNVRYYPTAAAAQSNGFRACRRCRPDAVPGSAEWNVRADVVGRAMRMIGDGVVDREGVGGLAVRLGYSARQVQRQLTAELGAGPVALARAQRAHTARVLLQTTDLPVTEIAFAAGFASVRQFNDTIRAVYELTPTGLRAAAPKRGGGRGTPSAGIPLRLAHRGPYQAAAVFDLLAHEALPGVEDVSGERGARTYRRTLRLPYASGIVAVEERDARKGGDSHRCGWLEARLHLTDLRDLTTAVQRLRGLFDLDADPYAVDERLSADPEEFAVRAAVGREEARRLVVAYGTPLSSPCGTLTHVFPAPEALAERVPLAAALADGTVRLDAGADRDDAERHLRAVDGVDAVAAAAIRTRALGDPDVAPPGEPVSDAWRPWRSYAVRHLRTERAAERAAEQAAEPARSHGEEPHLLTA